MLTGPDTMLPTMKDAKDFVGSIKWFLGLGPRPTVRPLDVLGEVRLLRGLLGRLQ